MTDSPIPLLKWTGQYAVSAPVSGQKLTGDKILLPPSALEQLLNASSNAAAENARRDLPQYDPYNSSTYSAYRQAESQYQDQRQQLPYPLMFRLVNPENNRVVYAGIREFSAEEGQVVLSPFLHETLGIPTTQTKRIDAMGIDQRDKVDENDTAHYTITIHARQLPKGTFVKLRPLEPGYDPEDWKALLEQHLRTNYTTMTNGEVLIVNGGRGAGGKKEEYRFLIDGFKPEAGGICVVDTDLEVDIEALNEEQARETMKRIAAKMAKQPGTEHGSSPGGELDLFKEQHGQVLPGEYVDYQLPSWNRTQTLEFELIAEDNKEDVNILINPFSPTQRAKPRIDEFVFADLDTRPTKRVRLKPTNAELEHAEALQVSVWAFAPGNQSDGHVEVAAEARHFTLRVKHGDGLANVIDLTEDTEETPPNEGDVRCKNCLQWVPQGRLVLHENFCLRNNIRCPKGCGQVFQKRSPEYEHHWHCPHDDSFGNGQSSRQQHETLTHPTEVLRCSDCSTAETFHNLPALARHRTTTCPGKPILCRFCHLEVPQEGDPDVPNAEALLSGMTVHELADGARTTECHLCQKIVRLRDMETHMKNHDLDRFNRQAPTPCRNIYCGRTLDTCSKNGDTRAGTRMGQGPGNEVGLCSVCFGPLYVSLHDPENKALRRRIERRYLQQLLTGCGKAHCSNEYCKTGRRNLELNTTITTKDALPMIKPFLAGLTESGESRTPLHFCVEQASQKKRNLAELLAAEDGGPTGKGGYRFEWALGALEAEGGDLDAARIWLKNWALARGEERR